MAIRLRPMTENDYRNSGGQVLRGTSMDHYEYLSDGLHSRSIFGESFNNKNTAEQSTTRDNVRGYIVLTKPVVNYVLARGGGELLAKILGIRSKTMEKILSFDKVWDTTIDELVSPSEIEHPSDMLMSGELLKKFIDDFSIEDAIVDEYKSIIREELFAQSAPEDLDIGLVSKAKGQFELFGGYYYTPSPAANKYVKKGRRISEVEEFIQNEYLQSGEERIVYLLNTSKDRIYGMLFNFITVLPPGMRPSIQKRDDQFTTQYADIIAANDNLAATKGGGYTVQEIIQRYSTLDKCIKFLVYKSNERKPTQFSVAEKLKSKRGFIRGKMLSKRVDYSGRSVIVVNPRLSIDECGLPKEMIPKLFRYHHLKEVPQLGPFKVINDSVDNNNESIERLGILRRVPVCLNRAPSLHRLSFLAYYAKKSKSKAIELNPLATIGYNADFDGDTMAAHVPLSDAAVTEVENLMLSTHNIFTPASGECTLVPRQEMIYGLNVATSSKYTLGESTRTFESLEQLYEAVMNHDVKVYETVTVSGSEKDLAGRLAVKFCLPQGMRKNIVEITKKSISLYIEMLLDYGMKEFKRSVDMFVQLGFRMSFLYAPTISILQDMEDDFLQDPFKDFHENMVQAIELYEDGLEEEKTFNVRFDRELKAVEKEVTSRIASALGPNNGFLRLVESGARGTVDNLIQIYAYKGRIAKSSNEAFNAVIENNFTTGLTPLEHFVSAYGTRKGLIDKVNKTADTGYQMRLMVHTCADAIITADDCGTTEGFYISKAELAGFLRTETDSEEEKQKAIDTNFLDMIVGRYEAGTNRYISQEVAEEITRDRKSVTVRSVITCKEQFCAKCFGQDLSIRGEAVVGLPIGILAGQSIGEPGTQLTMRTFQKGGVAGKGDVTSDFDRIKNFTHMSSLKESPTYDPIAWGVGKVIEKPKGLDKKRIMIEGYRDSVVVDINAEIKDEIKEIGEGFCIQEGDHDPNEVLKYKGIEAAQKYLVFVLYHTYLGKANINLKYFEVLVASMTLHLVLDTKSKNLKIGQAYTTRELNKLDNGGKTRVRSGLYGVKRVPLMKQSAMSNIMMENVVAGLSRAVAMQNDDQMEGILQNIMFGLPPKLGTSYRNYMVDRLERERCRS